VTSAGSVLTMDRAVANMQAFTGCSLTEALKMATLNPAEALGLAHRKGCLAPGYDADIVVLDEQGQSRLTMVRGEIVWQA
jgi:N-acetylglucosamine-6-phosphate deacetylase